MIGGGVYDYGSTFLKQIDCFNVSLTKSIITNGFITGGYHTTASHVGNYAIFHAGNETIAFNTSLSKTTITSLPYSAISATHIGNYALFSGVSDGSWNVCTYSYNTSLTMEFVGDISRSMEGGAFCNHSCHNNTHAFFINHRNIEVYDKSKTYQCLVDVNSGNDNFNVSATGNGNHALFGGAFYKSINNTMVSIDSTLTIKSAPSLGKGRTGMGATHIDDYVIFAFGNSTTTIANYADIYDQTLTRTYIDNSINISNRFDPRTTHVGSHAIFAGIKSDISSAANYYGIGDTDVYVFTLQ